MQRRQFIKTITAASTAPMMPLGLANALPVSTAQYAKAIEAANLWAYTTVGNLKLTLGVDTVTSQAVLNRLQADGVIGSTGPTGIALTKKFVIEQAQIAAKAATKLQKPKTANDLSQKVKDTLMDSFSDKPTDEEDVSETTDEQTKDQ